MPKILAGVPCYNGARTILPQCLEALRKRSGEYTDFEIVVCDDSGNEGHQIVSRQVCERFGARLVVHERNRGISAAWNTLVRSSDAPFIALFNDDLIVSPGWLEALDYFLANNPHAGCAGFHFDFMVPDDVPRLLADPNAEVLSRHPFTKELRPQSNDPNGLIGLCMCPPGCCFGFARDKFELIGGFDEEYRSFFEESDFGTALSSRDMGVYLLPWPTFGHLWSATFNTAPELQAPKRMDASRDRYRQKWGGDFTVTDPKYMGAHTQKLTKWLSPEGPKEAMR